ncbi:rna-directed dna polymerase from mobile element jockey-like [Willisornis vidua]|uniref:Rna-directed dna polymerase from mobile element jockey-like n=1 Tax=Willisornis vidua TaxID=1566151 RepID=A0ABQ9DQJ5_9PASS|nr:rna-directed dna polymerase from mobile element jockey-like [Willisornis vidua]
MLFSIFICDLRDGMKYSLTKFSDDTTLKGEVDTWERTRTLQEDLDRLEELGNKNIMKLNKEKCKVLPLEKHNPGVQQKLGSTHLGSSSVERSWGSWWTKLSVRDQCAAVVQQGDRMGGIRAITSRHEEIFIPLYSVLVRPHLG